MYAYDADVLVELDESVRVHIKSVEALRRSTVLTVEAAMQRIERSRHRLRPGAAERRVRTSDVDG